MRIRILWIVAPVIALALLPAAPASAQHKTNRINIEYVAPDQDEHKHVHALMQKGRVLEKVQEIFAAVRLPIDLSVKMKSCGKINAWYQRHGEDALVTVCYDYLAHVYTNVPKEETSTGLTAVDAVEGQIFYVIFHEMGHAMFDLLDIPIFGRPEDDADEFSTYIMLAFGPEDARRLITGAAYSYETMMKKPDLDVKMKLFADVHGASAQRYYNLLCLAYGAHPGLFADVAKRGFLPETRAKDCNYEYRELSYAFRKLVRPNIDPEIMKQVERTEWLPPEPEEKPQRALPPQ